MITRKKYAKYTKYIELLIVQNISSMHQINSLIDQKECVFKNILNVIFHF